MIERDNIYCAIKRLETAIELLNDNTTNSDRHYWCKESKRVAKNAKEECDKLGYLREKEHCDEIFDEDPPTECYCNATTAPCSFCGVVVNSINKPGPGANNMAIGPKGRIVNG